MMQTILRKLGLVMLALFGVAALAGAGKPLPQNGQRNWNATVTRTATGSHVLGNPAAKVKLVEYISYTCPHCAHFERESDTQLRLGFIATGKGSIEVRSFVRDGIDMTVALLTHCGAPSRFFANHSAFLRSQDNWIAPATSATDAQKQRWYNGPLPARTRAIASDLHFYDIMEKRGYSRAESNRCLGDTALAAKLAQATQDAADKGWVNGTPGFLLDGVPLAGTYSWAALKPQLEARLD